MQKKKNKTVYVACMIDMYAFIRPKEVCALKLKNSNCADNKIYIDKAISQNKKSQHVAILAPLREILMDYIKECKELNYFLLSKSGRPSIIPHLSHPNLKISHTNPSFPPLNFPPLQRRAYTFHYNHKNILKFLYFCGKIDTNAQW